MTEYLLQANTVFDVIINNAGVLKTDKPILNNGLDIRFMVNTISPYIICKELKNALSSDARIVNVSSAAQAKVEIAALAGQIHLRDDFQAYAQSKLALMIWTNQLAKSLIKTQSIIAVNPGSLLASKMVKDGFGIEGKDLSIGANILVDCALEPKFQQIKALYFDNDIGEFGEPDRSLFDSAHCKRVMTSLDTIIESYF